MINVIIADSQALTSKGLLAVFAKISDIQVIGTAANPVELQQLLAENVPELIVADPLYNEQFNLTHLKSISGQYPAIQFLILSQRRSKPELVELINQGFKCCVCKEAGIEELIQAVYTSARGERFLCEQTMHVLFGNQLLSGHKNEARVLSYRETEIVNLIANGMASREIADKLFLSVHTIKTHRKNIIKKLGFTFKNATELILLIGYLNEFFI